jgi:hypothetical protein
MTENWQETHSGSEAIEMAREILANPKMLLCQDLTVEVSMICHELILRVTGERITPVGIENAPFIE